MFKRFMPTRETIVQNRFVRWLGPRVHDPQLWHINRRAVARGVAIGAFFGLMIPVAQIPAAAVAALFVRANLLIAAVSTLVSNPFTYGPIYFFAYRLGSYILEGRETIPAGEAADAVAALDGAGNLIHWLTGIGLPLVTGMLIMAITGACIGYVAAQLFWRHRVLRRRRKLRARRACRAAAPACEP